MFRYSMFPYFDELQQLQWWICSQFIWSGVFKEWKNSLLLLAEQEEGTNAREQQIRSRILRATNRKKRDDPTFFPFVDERRRDTNARRAIDREKKRAKGLPFTKASSNKKGKPLRFSMLFYIPRFLFISFVSKIIDLVDGLTKRQTSALTYESYHYGYQSIFFYDGLSCHEIVFPISSSWNKHGVAVNKKMCFHFLTARTRERLIVLNEVGLSNKCVAVRTSWSAYILFTLGRDDVLFREKRLFGEVWPTRMRIYYLALLQTKIFRILVRNVNGSRATLNRWKGILDMYCIPITGRLENIRGSSNGVARTPCIKRILSLLIIHFISCSFFFFFLNNSLLSLFRSGNRQRGDLVLWCARTAARKT